LAATSKDRLFAEVERQLAEVRATADGLATRAGVLLTGTALAAGLLAARLATLRSGLIVGAMIALGVATLAGGTVLVPYLKLGSTAATLRGWFDEPATPTIKALYVAKVGALEANLRRLTVMRVFFYTQGVAVVVAIVLTIVAASGS
jgi:hypothetical protein